MMTMTRVLAAVALVAALAPVSGASFTTEVIFSGDGWYLPDAGSKPGNGYGLFEELSLRYTVASDMPEGSHCLYFMPDYSMGFRPEAPGGADVHQVTMGPDGINFDGQHSSWSALGVVWAPGYGISLGERYVPALDPGAVVGNHSWDLDGGGPDFTARVLAGKGAAGKFGPQPYRADFAMHRSLTWLSGQPIGVWMGGGMSPLLGGLPLDGLNDALNGFAPSLAGWDAAYYEVDCWGSMLLTGCSTPVPEPSTILLLSGGLAALGVVGRKRRF